MVYAWWALLTNPVVTWCCMSTASCYKHRFRPHKKNYLFLGHIYPEIDEGMRLFLIFFFFFGSVILSLTTA
jgi:hypothetical protein